jgi:hypothetical protein
LPDLPFLGILSPDSRCAITIALCRGWVSAKDCRGLKPGKFEASFVSAGFARLSKTIRQEGAPSMEDLAILSQKWKDSHPLKEWRRRKGYSTQQTALVLDVKEARILHLEAGESPTDDEMKAITQRTGITKDHWTTWEQAIPRG